MVFEIAISLGMNCQSRYHISRTIYIQLNGNDEHFYIGDKKNTANDYGSFFFDWSVTPIKSAISILHNNFEGILEFSNLEIITLPNGQQQILDRNTGCKYPHIFSKSQIDEGKTSNEFKKAFQIINQKYTYIIKKTLNTLASSQRILFVLTGNHDYNDVLNLCDSIERYTKNYKLLYTPWANKPAYQKKSPLDNDNRIIIRPILHNPYPGNFQSWNKAFKGIQLSIPN